mmetsp:Transcript_80830/g.147404  ORF Transcript_80830/g.147404 Transcript_80830/m.147404 type:complete len:132 (+) Transcript_80830:64-459(+)
MMQLKQLCALILTPLLADAVVVTQNNKLDINQKVYIEGQPILGDGAGEGALGQCSFFAAQHVGDPEKPEVKVCGTGIKMTVFLRGRCQGYYDHTHVVGKCDSTMPASTCDTYSAIADPEFGAYQSYKIEQC